MFHVSEVHKGNTSLVNFRALDAMNPCACACAVGGGRAPLDGPRPSDRLLRAPLA